MASEPINPTQITPPRVAFIDDRTGAISREWFRFFLSLQVSAQSTQDALLGPDTDSLVASYAAMLDTLAQDLESAPPCASVDDGAVLQTQIVDLEIEPPCASVEDVAIVQTQAQGLAEAILPDPQTFLLPVWSAIQDLALAPSIIVPVASAAAGSGTVTSVDASGGATGFAFTGGPITTSGTLTLSGTLNVANGGTGATTLTGYVKGSGTSAFTASATIPVADVTGLATVATSGSFLDLTNRPNDGVWYLRKDNSTTLTNTTALQKMFDVTTNGAMILEVGTYIFDWFFNVTGMSASTGNALISIIGAGTANINTGLIHAVGIDGAADTIATQNGKWVQANATTGNLFTATTNTNMTASVRGTFYCGTAGTIIPSIGLTTAIGTATVTANSYCLVTKITTPPATTRGSVS